MTAKERILSIRLLERQEKNPEYAKKIGIQVSMKAAEKDILPIARTDISQRNENR